MTTPARIAAFLSTSALCLGLASAPAYASQRDDDGQREAHTLTRDREPVADESAAETARPAEAAAQADQAARKR
ncbi:hypothetical protein [Bordetella sp. BOR01]|uniref:hypothetical protein n=1 Tax=Bordetella sp. BOR01 TaxID=2854779 RepID=UPI001C486906|nr:hypothetical protein [Bordetella sp. BOR01]MBV7486769.1 hypothetical protein [Bordetella sp. BOR01]